MFNRIVMLLGAVGGGMNKSFVARVGLDDDGWFAVGFKSPLAV
ncbi:hypothetical protein [Amycolatopsis eburnea]|nr:hypothetical protein [Amycolatopsis eburnea]